MPSELIKRQQITRITTARFRTRAFSWGRGDCVALAHFHLQQAGVVVPKLAPYKSLKGAVTALRRQGCDNLLDLIDKQGLERIPPARMMIGDIMAGEGDTGLHSILICLGPMMFGYHQDGDRHGNSFPAVIEVNEWAACWRVPI